jgi:4-aminobutyrate aminotransferase
MDHGKGSEVWDVDGNRFLDFAAGIAVLSTGHSNPTVVKAIQDQAEKFLHISSDFYHEKWIKLAEKFNEISPFEENAVCFMTNSGTESVEAAIKLARNYTGRSCFIGFLGGFHGRTMGSLAFTASKPHYKRGFFPLMNGVVHAPYPDPFRPLITTRNGESYGEAVVRYIEEEIFEKIFAPEDIAGILVEPIQGEGGYVVPADGFFPALRKICDKHGILMIADEVQSGMGRSGKWWAIEHFGVEPDIVCIAKGIASGIPIGTMMARESIAKWPKGSHGNTYGGNPIGCAAALATIDLIENGYLENAKETGAHLMAGLKDIQTRHECIGEVRGKGMMIGVEFVTDQQTLIPDHDFCERVVDLSFELGLITLSCGRSVIRIAPPLCMTKEEATEALQIFEEAITLAEKEK